jgi:NhaP-type Na+/H+ or K+/H+ antiporter
MIGLAILGAVLVGYALVAARLDRWSITAPIVFVMTGAALGLGAPEWLGGLTDPEPVKHVAELTLALLLFADAATLRWNQLREDGALPIRLLVVGFPLTVLIGIGFGSWVLPGVTLAMAALIASILAPTDAALGLGVFTNRVVPARIRRALNVESGLNDGMATPLVTLFLAVLLAEEGAGPENWVAESLTELGIGLAVALVVGLVAGHAIALAKQHEWMSPLSERLAVLASALVAYTAAVAAGGNGFVSAFVAGIVFAAASKDRLRERVEFTEDLALFASFLVWAIFGALLLAPLLREGMRLTTLLYSVLSLTVVRILPVAVAMLGTRLRPASIWFMGWFGPRGLASVVFTLIAFETLGRDDPAATVIEVATATVFLSVIAHGISAGPLARLYGRHAADQPVEHAGDPIGDPVPRSLSHVHPSGQTR